MELTSHRMSPVTELNNAAGHTNSDSDNARTHKLDSDPDNAGHTDSQLDNAEHANSESDNVGHTHKF